ncbi:MAG: 50S ribosomal protein L5 [Patescibacteria group bacterium]
MNLQQTYKETVVPAMVTEFGIENAMAVPKVTRVVVNIGMKEAAHDKSALEKTTAWLADITGQKPKQARAKKSIANFKLREGDIVGLTVTLRGKRMYDFMLKLFSVVLPRVRDFHGVSTTAFDKKGNYTLGLSEQIVFPEIEYGKIDKIRGLEITFVNTAGDPIKAKRMLELFGMPFKKEEK